MEEHRNPRRQIESWNSGFNSDYALMLGPPVYKQYYRSEWRRETRKLHDWILYYDKWWPSILETMLPYIQSEWRTMRSVDKLSRDTIDAFRSRHPQTSSKMDRLWPEDKMTLDLYKPWSKSGFRKPDKKVTTFKRNLEPMDWRHNTIEHEMQFINEIIDLSNVGYYLSGAEMIDTITTYEGMKTAYQGYAFRTSMLNLCRIKPSIRLEKIKNGKCVAFTKIFTGILRPVFEKVPLSSQIINITKNATVGRLLCGFGSTLMIIDEFYNVPAKSLLYDV